MKTLIALKTTFICFFLLLNSCSKKDESILNELTFIINEEHSILLEKPVLLNHKEAYNLHWNSNLPEHKVAYNLSVNGKLLKRNLTKTVISENENIIEFNVPVTDYSIPKKYLKQGKNTIQIIAEYNSAEIYQSNKIEINHNKINYLVSN